MKAIWNIFTWPYYRVKEEIAFRKRVKEMKKKEDKVKEVVMRELKLKKQPNEEELRERLGFLCYDNLEELVMTEKNLFDRKITIEELIK